MCSGCLVCAVIVYGLVAVVNAGFFRDEIYSRFDHVSYCYRRLNGTHTIGCTSKMNGNVGVVYFLFSASGFDDFAALAPYGAPPYTLVLPLHIFTSATAARLRQLNAKKLVNGAVFYRGASNIANFSTADPIPNRYVGYYAGKNDAELPVWNPDGTNLQNERFDFPIFYVNGAGDELKRLERCYDEFNRPYHLREHKLYPMCSVRLKSFMFARDNSRRCYGRSVTNEINTFVYCDSLESRNLLTVVTPVRSQPKPVILLATRLDSTSFFSETAPGATTVVSNLVTLLTTVHLIRNVLQTNRKTTNRARNLMIALFGGETYDFMGSQRFVYDWNSSEREPIDLLIELNQLTNSQHLFLHYTNDLLTKNKNASEFRRNLETNLPVNYTLRSLNDPVIPPSSTQSFLVANASFPALIVSGFGTKFTNRFYDSELDTGRNSFNYTYKATAGANYQPHEIQSVIKTVAESLAKSVLGLLMEPGPGAGAGTGGDFEVPEADLRLIDELLFCYLENLNCTIHRLLNLTIGDRKPNYYLGVAHSHNPIPIVVKFTLAWLSGLRMPNISTREQCLNNNDKDPEYFWLPETLQSTTNVCLYAKIDANSSKSPAFLIDDYDWNSRMYSTWTESTWDDIKMELFIQPSINADFVAIALGFFTLCASIIATYLLRSKADILFANHH